MNPLLANTPAPRLQLRSAGFRYGFLAFIVALLLVQVLIASRLSDSYRLGRFFGFIVPLMLLFNHLAYQFHWPRTVAVTLRAIAWLWIAFAVPYMIYAVFIR